MDQDTARFLLVTGATFVLEDLPPGSEFGIDMNVYTVGEKFKGVKMMPAGVHFVYFSSRSDYDQRSLSPRSGFFKVFAKKEMYAKKWNKCNEDIDSSEASEEDKERYRNCLIGTLDQFLAPYDLSSYEKWSGLTDCISEEMVRKLNPRNGRIHSVPELIPESFSSSRSCRMTREDQVAELPETSSLTSDQLDRLLPQLQTEPSSAINFTVIEKSLRPAAGYSAADVTAYSLDSSHVLLSLMHKAGSGDAVLGELQYAFVCFLIGHVYEAFTHWKDMMRLICRANRALQHNESFFLNFIRVLHFQVQEVPADLFVDIVNCNNFLLMTLRDFFFNLENNESICPELKRRGCRFRASLEKKFKWDFSVENSDDDEAPVILQSDE